MAESRIIAVIGATGAQGGGLVRAIVQTPESGFRARAITRNPASDRAKALADLGVEIVKADTDDEASLVKAFSGAYGAYCVTNFWEHFSPDREKAQAGNMARAAKANGLHHVIWSTLEDTRKWVPVSDDRMPTLMEKYKVPHFDAKGEANAFFRQAGIPTTFLLTSFYWENLIHFGMGPKRGPDGRLAITFPLGARKLPSIAVGDIGGCALGIFSRAAQYIGRTVGVAGEHLTGAQMAVELSGALGQDVVYNDVPPEVYRGFGFPGAEDLGNMFQFNRDFADDFCASRNLDESRRLNPSLQTFAAWLAVNKDRIPMP
jgi:uncharacterized protein YbjT (DUF2867 family)